MGVSIDDTAGGGFPQRWAAVLRDCVVPMTSAEVQAFLSGLACGLTEARSSGGPAAAARLGEQLVAAHFVDDRVLGRSIAAIHSRFGESAHPAGDRTSPQLSVLLEGFATGYVRAFREWILAEQESIRAADVAARRTAEQQLRASEARLRAVFAQAGVGTGISDISGRIIEVNQTFAHMLGYEVDEFCARFTVTDLTHPDDDATMWQRYAELVRGEHECLRMEKAYLHRDGSTLWTNLNVSLIRDQNGDPQYTLVLIEDISEQRQLREALRHQASHDVLTGLPNRAQFFDALTAAFDDPDSRVGVCYIDLDRFKIINDTLGHDCGDRLLVAVAHRLRDCVRGSHRLVARLGGDEFVVLVRQSTDVHEVAAIAEDVSTALAEPFDIDGHRLGVSASIGVMEERTAATTASDLMKAADTTMYWAKRDGTGRPALFGRARGTRGITRHTLSLAMRAALDRGEFFVEYQPIVALADGTVRGVEALVRWQHPTLHTLGPDAFIDVAEENGLIEPLGAFVLEQACRDCRHWRDTLGGDAPFVSVNLAARQVSNPHLVADVQRMTDAAGIGCGALQLELTERSLVATDGRPLSCLHALSELGIRIAIDDFGTGYSKLAYLGRLPIDVIKLAGPFISRIDDADATGSPDALVLASVIDLAHGLGLTVTAECVETATQAATLTALGCDTAQGWYFAKSMPAHDITEHLTRPPHPPP